MESILKRRSTLIAVVAVLGVTAVAYAFWSASGAGTGTAATDAASGALTITGDAVSGLAPGQTVALTGTIVNPNNYDVRVSSLQIDSIAVDAAHLGAGCTLANYSFSNTPVTVNTTLQETNPGATDTVAFPAGLTVTMLETGVNQDVCKGATITVDYSTN